ncbi:MAG: FAD-dependent oxidoreductase [Actinomycetales bacterium mxb001]|nr:MAG: FAD-dependent oxidoreductase [Actinomycetales bacterium mxb001]
MPFPTHVTPQARASLADVQFTPYWLDNPDRPAPRPALTSDIEADLVVIGGGFSGLWTAYLATERFPEWRVVLLEGDRIAAGATGRNGGFIAASLTHGLGNGMARWPTDMARLTALGMANLDELERTIEAEGIGCDFLRSGELDVAVAPYQVEGLREMHDQAVALGLDHEFLDRDQVRALVDSPTYQAGVLDRRGVAMADPAQLAWGLAAACERRGVTIHEATVVNDLADDGSTMRVVTDFGSVRAKRVALGTSAYPPLLRRLGHYVVPVYDSVLMTEPLTAEQRESIGWRDRFGIGDAGNQFHYYRITHDGRILWGGYDASFYGSFNPMHERQSAPFARLAEHFRYTFPQLDGLRFTHAWAGAIDTCSRFSAFWGTAYSGKVSYSVGFTGLGTGASRFGAQVMLDLLSGERTERTSLEMVRTKPIPFPPEPLRSLGIGITRRAIDKADRNEGRRNLWLRTLDRVGLGFDS